MRTVTWQCNLQLYQLPFCYLSGRLELTKEHIHKPVNELLSRRRTTSVAISLLLMESSYLVDPASSHMLVSKIKPCKSKYKQIYTVKLRTAH